MASDINLHQNGNGNVRDGLQHELDLLLRDQRNQDIVNQERELNMYRSGSAPPTIQGSLRAVGSLYQNADSQDVINNGLLTEDEIRSHPEYLSYYYSHENINPRLPPPLLSKEDWRVAQRFHGVSSGTDDWRTKRMIGESEQSPSLFSMQPGLVVQETENNLTELRNASGRNMFRQTSSGWLDAESNGHTEIPRPGMGSRRKSFADILQEGLERPVQTSNELPRSVSRNAIGPPVGTTGNELMQGVPSGVSTTGLVRSQRHASNSHLFAPTVGSSVSRNSTPEPQTIGRSPGPIGGLVASIGRNSCSAGISELADIEASLSGISFSHVQSQPQKTSDHLAGHVFSMPNGHSRSLQHEFFDTFKADKLVTSASHGELPITAGFAADHKALDVNESPSIPRRAFSSTNLYSNVHPQVHTHVNGPVASYQNANFPSTQFFDHVDRGYAINNDEHLVTGFVSSPQGRMPTIGSGQVGPSRILNPQLASYLQQKPDYGGQNGPSQFHAVSGNSQSDFLELQKAYLEVLRAQQKQQYELSLGNGLNHGFHLHNSYGLGTPFRGMPVVNTALSPYGGFRSPGFQNEQQLHASMRRQIGSWRSNMATSPDGRTTSSLLEDFKNSKGRALELSDMFGHVIEFSMDQYGSRFIQQKLEAAKVDEKEKIFSEITPHARTLMTDVFGNYVIQKFFEHGKKNQRKELADQLRGHVLSLSLQMYGCRVIQKRSLEYCNDPRTQEIIMNEVMQSVSTLAQDQYGNYVIQHILEHGKPHERCAIISKLAGQIVKMSQQKFASNVIEKCLTFGGPKERQLLVDEMLGSTEENEPLQAMMKDPFGNYVVQKVLETCDDQSLELILSRIKVHLNGLKRYTYGKHIVSRVEQLIATGERRISLAK
uniref:PUM-HD domain-containing protein n=1 Tax=Kalanchoe fedtschenkoi TaxID=63787 RepID=A0A7N0RDZ9_KALFE